MSYKRNPKRNWKEKYVDSVKSTLDCVDSDKKFLQQEYKTYRNGFSILLKQSTNYIQITLNTKESKSPKIILNNKGEYLTNPNEITN